MVAISIRQRKVRAKRGRSSSAIGGMDSKRKTSAAMPVKSPWVSTKSAERIGRSGGIKSKEAAEDRGGCARENAVTRKG